MLVNNALENDKFYILPDVQMAKCGISTFIACCSDSQIIKIILLHNDRYIDCWSVGNVTILIGHIWN